MQRAPTFIVQERLPFEVSHTGLDEYLLASSRLLQSGIVETSHHDSFDDLVPAGSQRSQGYRYFECFCCVDASAASTLLLRRQKNAEAEASAFFDKFKTAGDY